MTMAVSELTQSVIKSKRFTIKIEPNKFDLSFSCFSVTSGRWGPVVMSADSTATWSGLRLPRISSVRKTVRPTRKLYPWPDARPASIIIRQVFACIYGRHSAAGGQPQI